MKTILTICSSKWIAPDMQSAAKIADLISKLEPVNRDYRNSGKEVYVVGQGRDHALEIHGLDARAQIVKTLGDALKLRGKEDGKNTDMLGFLIS